MKYSNSNIRSGVASACALALALMAGAASAELKPANSDYLIDQHGSIVKSDYGLCWNTGTGPAPSSRAACEPAPIFLDTDLG